MSKDKREDDTKKIVREEEPTLGEGPDRVRREQFCTQKRD